MRLASGLEVETLSGGAEQLVARFIEAFGQSKIAQKAVEDYRKKVLAERVSLFVSAAGAFKENEQ